MNKRSRLSLFTGILFVVFIAAGLLLYFEAARSAIKSTKAEISAESYSVGTDYTGLISKQYVQEGDTITAGQTLFQVKSSTLLEQMKENSLEPSQLIYPLTPEGEIILKAPKAGTVGKIFYSQGSFIPANKEIATIIDEESVKVTATFKLPRRDFALLNKNTRLEVRLPNGNYLNGTVSAIRVISQDQYVETEVDAKLERFKTNQLELTSGTPVESVLYLKEQTAWKNLKNYVMEKL